jgi:glycosyltransferase involved in cell wall biosynthesis
MPWLFASRTVVTVHDVIHLKFPEFWPSRAARLYASFFFRCVVPKARAILTVSENTKRDLMEMLSIPESRITVTPLAVDHARFSVSTLAEEADFRRLGLPRDYLLYIGNLKEFKNVPRLVDAYRQVRARRQDCPELVLVGRNFIPGFERKIVRTAGIRWVGEVQRDLLPCLYKHALFFIFPSLYEGFGLPPLEAMASGTPVLCSDRASLPEVVGGAALLINPENTDDLAAAIERLIQDSALRQELSAKGTVQARQFSWDRMARQTLEVYNRCLS